jgi:hypothetical protein
MQDVQLINGNDMKILYLLGWMPNVNLKVNLQVIILRIIDILTGTFKNIFKLDKELCEARLKICNRCRKRNKNRCSLCGCVLTSKTRLKNAECHIGKWNKINMKNNER